MASLFEPDRLFARITAIDIERDLLRAGLTAVLLDIDNTLRSRETGAIPRDVGVWLGKARDAGVEFCLLSNNWHSDVHEFAGSLDLPIVAKAMKPLPFAYLAALHKLNETIGTNERGDMNGRAGMLGARDMSETAGKLEQGTTCGTADIGAPHPRIARSQAVSIGDQLFTDVIGAHLAGIKAYMVAPLAEADLKHTLMLRNLESRLIGRREPEPVPAPAIVYKSEEQ